MPGRIGAGQILNTNTDYRSDSSRPHLLTARTHAGVITVHALKGIEHPTANQPGAAPLSSKLWHYTAYPAEPEATWAQPLSRGELS
jgi:hypothetical protein